MCLYARPLSEAEGRLVRCEIRHGRDAVYVKRCQVILASAQGMRVKEIAKLTLLSEYHIRELIHSFNQGGLPAIKPRKPRGRDPVFTDEERASIAEFARIPPRVLGYIPLQEGIRVGRNTGGGERRSTSSLEEALCARRRCVCS